MNPSKVDTFLEHYGVLGMKWGVRNEESRARIARAQSSDSQRHSANRKRGVKALQDDELQKLVNRMNMEQQYSRLNRSRVSQGHNYVRAALAVGVTMNAVVAFAKTPAGQFIARQLGRLTDTSKAVSTIGR